MKAARPVREGGQGKRTKRKFGTAPLADPHWAAGGPTDLDNLMLLCRFHHLAVHEGIAAITVQTRARTGDPAFAFTGHDDTAITPPPADHPLSLQEIQQRQVLERIDQLQTQQWNWNDPEAAQIRPQWRGEPFDLGYIVATMFTRLTLTDNNTDNNTTAITETTTAA